jgi:hypothetical protein
VTPTSLAAPALPSATRIRCPLGCASMGPASWRAAVGGVPPLFALRRPSGLVAWLAVAPAPLVPRSGAARCALSRASGHPCPGRAGLRAAASVPPPGAAAPAACAPPFRVRRCPVPAAPLPPPSSAPVRAVGAAGQMRSLALPLRTLHAPTPSGRQVIHFALDEHSRMYTLGVRCLKHLVPNALQHRCAAGVPVPHPLPTPY